ncbi:MAG: hypothetical protein DRJ03_15020 [Chloroflexi bacterium]|nr:MAG: hypothetical protein B6I35_03085 [Anaerolineaceae bacterium 4572_32.2]RLC78554.1 MAG: hypothetical protein DRI81_06415 [Chloroflexota bacterium]RLC84169.1 MAG: hypothetical protein DRJ03_15020 [Chloroflexota bacterium]HEY71671.1 hypothetical protein [Thermoflexia bacterium]
MQEITVRRAKPSDAAKIAAFVNRGRRGQVQIDKLAVIERFGSVGMMVAELGDKLVGMLGWRAENLIVRVTDLLIAPIPEGVAVARELLSEMEQTAGELQCEAALLFLPRPHHPKLVKFCNTLGYESQIVGNLPKAWQEAAVEARVGGEEAVLVKQLRTGRVARPL